MSKNIFFIFKLSGLLILLLGFESAHSQTVFLDDPLEDYLRLLNSDSLQTQLPSFNVRPVTTEDYYSTSTYKNNHPWKHLPFFQPSNSKSLEYYIYSPKLFTSYNTSLPVGSNDGALWQGKGINTSLVSGGRFSYGILDISFRPEVHYSQNLEFELSRFAPPNTVSEFGDPRSYSAYIDRPQRYGASAVSRFHPGQSWVRLKYHGVTAGVSTANIWSGPAFHNPMIFSNNAPGFPHAFIGSYKPVQTPIGNFEWTFLGGRLKESNYFDQDSSNDKRFLNALVLNYSPSFAPGLHVGGARMIQKPMPKNGISSSDMFEVFQPFLKKNLASEENPGGNLGSHQLLSLFARWAFPNNGMEVYAEWSRNDHSADFRDLLRHFEHARAYLLGLNKKIELTRERWLAANVEIIQLEVPRLQEFRHTGSYYNNSEVPQGFTNYGQVIGSGIGPGSNSQRLSVKYYTPKGLMGFSLNRIVHHNDRLYQLYIRDLLKTEPKNLHNVEFRTGLHGLFFMPEQNIELQAELYWSHFLNYDYQYKNDRNNLNLQVTLRYILPGMRR